MLACELIDNNGKELLKCVNQYIEQWGLEDGFKKYVNEDCTFWTVSFRAASKTQTKLLSLSRRTATLTRLQMSARYSAYGLSKAMRS